MKHLLSFLACGLLLHTSLQSMQKQRLLAGQAQLAARAAAGTAPAIHVSYQHGAPKSETLIQLATRRNPNENPFFDTQTRDKNFALVTSIGAQNTTAKMALLAALFFALNGAKDVISSGFWGGTKIFPTTDLIPPGHLMNLQPCSQICYTYCSLPDPTCFPDCTDQWDCSGGSTTMLNALGTACGASLAVNGAGLLASIIVAFRSCNKAVQSEKQLEALLQQLDALTDYGIAKESKVKTPAYNSVQVVIDRQLVQHMESSEQELLDQKRKTLIAQILETGSLAAKWKMCALIAAIFGANLVKDAALCSLWGVDTLYPLTPLIHNFSSPLMPCQQVCWQSGCCTMDCESTAPCITECGVDCIDIQSSPNAFGYTSGATLLANFTGMVTSGLLAFRYYSQDKKADTALEDELKKLDGLIASDAEAIN